MASAGERSTFVEIRAAAIGRTASGQRVRDAAATTLWRGCWARFLPVRGGEQSVARGLEVETTATFSFDFMDVMNPAGDGVSIDEGMTLVIPDFGLAYNITAVHPDLQTRKDVTVQAIRVRQGV